MLADYAVETAAGTTWQPKREDFREHVQEVFAASAATRLIGASLGRIAPGHVEVILPCSDQITQQHGFVHGGVLGMIADAAAALSALTVAAPGTIGVTVEYKINLLEAAFGELIIARGRLIRPGQAVSIAAADLYSVSASGREQMVATSLFTLAGRTRRRRRA